MTEYELIYLSSEYNDIVWGILQQWISISFGLVAVAFFASNKLTKPLLITLNFLYISSSIFLGIILVRNMGIQLSFATELNSLFSATELSAPGKIIAAGPSPAVTIFALITEFGTFISSIVFLNYSYKKTS